ncbi:hypothetical protein M758_UG238800 [Ceratodon purpureus]|nr:hypothetical protein M758_UG238800 [Ceratodon purpureus]
MEVKGNDGGESSGNPVLNVGESSDHSMSLKRSIDNLDATDDNNAEEQRTGGEEGREDGSLLKRRFSELQKKRAGYKEHLDSIDSDPKLSYLQLTFKEFIAQTEALESEFEEGENQETIYKEFLASKLPRREREILWLLRANRFELVQRSKRQWRESGAKDENKTQAKEDVHHTVATKHQDHSARGSSTMEK